MISLTNVSAEGSLQKKSINPHIQLPWLACQENLASISAVHSGAGFSSKENQQVADLSRSIQLVGDLLQKASPEEKPELLATLEMAVRMRIFWSTKVVERRESETHILDQYALGISGAPIEFFQAGEKSTELSRVNQKNALQIELAFFESLRLQIPDDSAVQGDIRIVISYLESKLLAPDLPPSFKPRGPVQ